MKTEFKVKALNNSFDVVIYIDDKLTSITTFPSVQAIDAASKELLEKAQSSFTQALAMENKLNSLLNISV